MKFSFFMMPVHHPSESPHLAFQRDISFIHLADELGYDEFFIGEHHSGGWETMPAPEMALSMAAAKAHRIRLGTSVVDLPFHHPFHVAERMAFLDHLTGGRAILGVGPSNLVTDKQLFALPQDRLYPMMAESIDIIVRLLESPEPFDYDGEFWKFENMRLQLRSFQQPRLPLAIASSSGSDAVLELAGKYDMHLWSTVGKNRPTDHAENWSRLEAAAARHGKTPSRDDWRLATCMYIAETREKAWADVEQGIMREAEYFSAIGLMPAYESYAGQPFAEFTARSCADRRDWLIGTPDDAIAWIEQKQKDSGGFGGLMLTTHEWADTNLLRNSMEMFARYVMPHFRGHNATYQDEWRRIKEERDSGGVTLNVTGRPNNLASY
ncbi:MAG: LLM class flavin-dependent oxidoreductase [Rhodospirillales bacterium]|nr:LLM class flavin-dependent oxidoreductase [Rhodospirillales bacterium]